MNELRQKYIEEVTEMLVDMEQDILSLDETKPNQENLQKIFRAMHTIKGTSGMYGFNEIESFTHRLENIYDEIIEGKLKLNSRIVELTLQSGDYIRSYLKTNGEDQNVIRKINAIFEELEQFSSETQQTISHEKNHGQKNTRTNTIIIDFFPEHDLFVRGINALSTLEELSDLGKCYFRFITKRLPSLNEIDYTLAYVKWQIVLITEALPDEVDDIFLFVPDEYKIIGFYEQDLSQVDEITRHLNQHSNHEFDMAIFEKYAQKSQTISFTFDDDHTAELPSIQQPNDPETFNEIEKILSENTNTNIKVSSDKLDDLMNLVSQLFTTKAELQLITEQHPEIEALKNIAEKIEKLTNSLRENALTIRLVPINEMVGKFKRLVHDLTNKLHKEIDFVIEGGDTEIDKSIMEQAVGPLMHIIRNAIDHGIEAPNERKAKGKPEKGVLKFIAFYSSASVFIQVHDDGKGIDHNFIRQLAIEKGLIPPHTALSRKEAYDLIFLPGFSTSMQVSEVSGRGFGMDVVKKQISSLRGEIHVDSEIDLGTSITLKLPITLSIIETLHVRISHYNFLIPLHLVESSFEVSNHFLKSREENHISLNDNLYPFVFLDKHFQYPEKPEDVRKLVLVNFNNEKIGFVVDSIVGQYQAVFKPLGDLYKHQTDISGASILGDGNIALLLDVNSIIKAALNKV